MKRTLGAPRPAVGTLRAVGVSTCVAAACLTLGTRTAAAQGAPTLDRVEAAADSGRVDSARAMLERWYARRSEEAPPRARHRARFLGARLTADADSAAERYLRVAVDGGAEYGDRAWLRLAQLRLAEGEPERALRALDRLRSDYPGSGTEAESWLWTGHARRAAGRPEGACSAWRRAARAAEGAERPVARRARRALGSCPEGAAEEAEPARAAADSVARDADRAPAADSARSGWAVQLGAFSARANAERLRRTVGERVPAEELAIVPPGPGDELFRVQTRPPTDRSAARRLHRDLEARGVSSIVVRIRP